MSVVFAYANSELTMVHELCHSLTNIKNLGVVELNDRMSSCFYFTGGVVYPLNRVMFTIVSNELSASI